MSPDVQGWACLAGLFGSLLRERAGRPVERLALYVADLRDPVGLAMGRALHAVGIGSHPGSAKPVAFGLLSAEEMEAVVSIAGPMFVTAALRLRHAPPPGHVRIVVAFKEAAVHAVDAAHIEEAALVSSPGGIS